MNSVFSVLIGGILPFGSVFIELFFILTSMWLQQVRQCSRDLSAVMSCQLDCATLIVPRTTVTVSTFKDHSPAVRVTSVSAVAAVLLSVRVLVPGVHHLDHHLRGNHYRALLLPTLFGRLPLVVRRVSLALYVI